MSDDEKPNDDVILMGSSEQNAREQVEASGLRFRVMRRNGKSMIGTRDLNMDRVNVHIDDGKVTRVYRG